MIGAGFVIEKGEKKQVDKEGGKKQLDKEGCKFTMFDKRLPWAMSCGPHSATVCLLR